MAPAAAHVFIADLGAGDADVRLELEAGDAHHLLRVLRLRDGAEVTAADGSGSWRMCRLRLETGSGPLLEATGPLVHDPAPEPAITVAVALPKGDRGDWAVQKLTELGVDTILPLVAERSVVRRTGDRAGRGRERLERISRAAAMQSRRARLPALADPASPAEVVGRAGGACAAEPGGGPPSLERPVVLVGPEGGWAAGELPGDLPRIGLGPGILRTETAAVAAATALVLLRAGLTGPPPGPARG